MYLCIKKQFREQSLFKLWLMFCVNKSPCINHGSDTIAVVFLAKSPTRLFDCGPKEIFFFFYKNKARPTWLEKHESCFCARPFRCVHQQRFPLAHLKNPILSEFQGDQGWITAPLRIPVRERRFHPSQQTPGHTCCHAVAYQGAVRA